ncbi:DNA (cytosine-5-)-methyltransferase [Candidatus Omnitrophus magneticus]|uniref:Cytosine-specific methyltransferase n=1 Tax=Candidatus Omnitrophus magneticus TaxID=1609969 RepID=A0A0F0CRA4_9BACT|nr:DNA (cytosine-5-)-methyltransferase [Candidatus Omnitrophus magneticus]
MRNSVFTFIDLFAGIGGIRLGFEKAGCQCVWTNEINQYATETYKVNFGDRDFVLNDIKKVDIVEIPVFDILCGGFPCQPFSIAGVSKKNSLNMPHGFEDETQGTLFYEIIRILREKRPAAFFLENVKNLKRHDNGRTFAIIKGALEDIGYSFYYKVINAKLVVPQNRERIFMIGFKDKTIDFCFPEIPTINPKIKDILDKDVHEKYTLTDHLWNYLQKYAEKHRLAGNGFGFGLVDVNKYSRTLSARYYKDGSEILIPQKGKNPRRLTPRECARLQGFPDSFKIPVSDTQAYKQFGNSVVVPIVEILAKSLVRTLNDKPRRRVSYSTERQMSMSFT